MPLLAALREELAQERPFDGLRLGMCLHVEPKTAVLVETLAAGGAEVRQTAEGETGELGSLTWRVLWPPARGMVEPGNPASVVLDVEGGGLRSLFLGDLGEEAQARMLRQLSPGPVDVVKVSHHGSADQSAALYERLAARVGLISCGAGNDYGHPTARVLGILADSGTTAYRTDLEGMLVVAPSSGGVRVWTERAPTTDPSAPARSPVARRG
jgi:competence protein ComEC